MWIAYTLTHKFTWHPSAVSPKPEPLSPHQGMETAPGDQSHFGQRSMFRPVLPDPFEYFMQCSLSAATAYQGEFSGTFLNRGCFIHLTDLTIPWYSMTDNQYKSKASTKHSKLCSENNQGSGAGEADTNCTTCCSLIFLVTSIETLQPPNSVQTEKD